MFDYSYFGGIDLAKNHFSIHVVDSQDKVVLHKSVTCSKLLATIANTHLYVYETKRVAVHIIGQERLIN